MIAAAEQAPRYSDLHLADMGQNGQEKAVVLFNLLTQWVEGRALITSSDEHGEWQRLCSLEGSM